METEIAEPEGLKWEKQASDRNIADKLVDVTQILSKDSLDFATAARFKQDFNLTHPQTAMESSQCTPCPLSAQAVVDPVPLLFNWAGRLWTQCLSEGGGCPGYVGLSGGQW
ncbi:hypothetical protein J4Q44_G00354880 [Coregonus suidteri]|uniref:Uncharacterized protein n=1 Tax=Coregonus suidteri TaxID=861788 RepID=A0AAN8KNY4_9TELE